jgi:Amt family ammonium transporter
LLDADTDQPIMQFDVNDTGIGMTDEQIGNLFQPFVQADSSTTRKFGGTGLGLTISKRLAEMPRGDILAHSTIGRGSTFAVTVTTGPLAGVDMIESLAEVKLETEHGMKSDTTDMPLDCRVL